MNTLKMEWKKLLSKPLLIGTMFVLMFIPIIYGGFFLGASWDPYGKTDRLPVAVVNQDQPAEYEGTQLAVGDELVDNLKDNQDLEWHFTDKKEAEKGMDEGKYFMVLTIPEDFSFNASTVMGVQPKPMNLQYETNPGRGFFIEAVSKQATADIREQISESVTKEYVKAVFDQIQTIGDGMDEAADGAVQLTDGAAEIHKGNATLSEKLGELATGTLTFKQGAEKLEVGAGQFAAGAAQLDEGAGQLRTGVFAYTDGVGQLQSGIAGLADGTSQLTAGGAELVEGSAALADGLGTLLPGAQQLNSGLADAENGSGQLNAGLQELQTKTAELAGPDSGIQQLANGQRALNDGLDELAAGSSSLEEGLKALQQGLPSQDQVNSLQQGLASIRENAAKLAAVASAGDANGAASLQASLSAAKQALDELQISSSNAAEAVKNTSTYNALAPEQQSELIAAIEQSAATQSANQQASIDKLAGNLAAINSDLNNSILPAFQSLGSLPEQAAGLSGAIAQVNPAASEALGGYETIQQALNGKLIPGAGSLTTGINEAAAGSGQLLSGVNEAASSLPQLAGAVDSLAKGSESLNQGVSALSAGSNGLVEGAGALKEGSAQLQQGTAAYTEGVAKVADGTNELKQGADELAGNSAALQSGADDLASGISSLNNGVPTLINGVNELAGGAGDIGDGAQALESGAGELGDGAAKLETGSTELADRLAEGAQEINGTDLSDANYEMIAAPASATESKISEVPNYGHAMAPYILSLGLYVGALSFNLVFPINGRPSQPTSGAAWWLSKFLLGFVQATAAALIVDAIMIFGFHLQVDHVGEFIAISIITSLAYMFLIMFLSIALGNPGRFVAMIILVLQLGASGGTFPIELTNSFFQKVHDFVPMSYALLGFRESMSSAYGSETFILSVSILGGFVLAFNLLLWAVLSVRNHKLAKLAASN